LPKGTLGEEGGDPSDFCLGHSPDRYGLIGPELRELSQRQFRLREAHHQMNIAVRPLKRFSCANNGEYKQNGGSNMRGSSLIWTIVGVLAAIALIIWIVSAV